MFNRRTTRFFRKDGHDWRKKADGKTVKETHEKLKVRAGLGCEFSPRAAGQALCRVSLWILRKCACAQVANQDMLNCYYAHSQEKGSLQV